MRLELKIDYDGNPYIEMVVGTGLHKSAEQQLLELFIRKALECGVRVENEADMDTRTDYASIRIEEKE